MSAVDPAAVHDPVFVGLDGRLYVGVRRVFPVANPAPGAEWSVSVPGGRMWRLLGASATLTTSVAVANRKMGFQVAAQGTVVFAGGSNVNVAASSVQAVAYSNGIAASAANPIAGFLSVAYAPMWMQPGDSMGSLTSLLQAADQYGAISLYIEEMFTDATLMSEYHTEYVEAAQIIARLAGGS